MLAIIGCNCRFYYFGQPNKKCLRYELDGKKIRLRETMAAVAAFGNLKHCKWLGTSHAR